MHAIRTQVKKGFFKRAGEAFSRKKEAIKEATKSKEDKKQDKHVEAFEIEDSVDDGVPRVSTCVFFGSL